MNGTFDTSAAPEMRAVIEISAFQNAAPGQDTPASRRAETLGMLFDPPPTTYYMMSNIKSHVP